jgi:hypothetical protein
MIIATDQLDPPTRQYLRDIERTKGEGFHGVYAWQAPSARPEDGWLKYVAGGCAILLGALLVPEPDFLLNAWGDVARLCWRPGLAVIGTVLLVVGVRRLTYLGKPALHGDFLFVDALHAWEVAPEQVEVTPLDGLVGVEVYSMGVSVGTSLLGHTLQEKSGSLYTVVALRFPLGAQELIIREDEVAERLKSFLDNLLSLKDRVDAEAELRGALAARLSAGQSICSLDQLTRGPSLPRPTKVTAS